MFQKRKLGLNYKKAYVPIFTQKNNIADGSFTLLEREGVIF